MERIFNPPLTAPNFSTGYWAQMEGRKLTDMSQPSANVRLTRQGQAYTRPGYLDTAWNLNQAGKVSVPYRMIKYPLTFFAVGTKVFYRKDSDGLVIDTGITLTDGTVSTFMEYAGTTFVGNTTDGWYKIAVGTLNGAVATADTRINLGVSDGIRFGQFTGNLRINGTDIAYDQTLSESISDAVDNGVGLVRITSTAHGLVTGDRITISGVVGTTEANGTWTITVINANTFDLQGSTFANAYVSDGAWVISKADRFYLTGTAGADYIDGEIVIYTEFLPNVPKALKGAIWKESMNLVGVQAAVTGYDVPKFTHFYSDFAVATTAGMAKIYAFSGGKSGAQPLGVTGELTNVVQTVDRLFLFKEDSSYFIRVGDVVISDGTRPATVFSPVFGCVNQFCAVEMEGTVVFLTKNKRVIRSTSGGNTATSTTSQGVPAQGQTFADESFDRAIYELLLLLDDDQSSARMHYWTTGRLLFIVCKIGGQKVSLIYDNNVGVWLPPSTNYNFNGFFEIGASLYAVSDNDDTIYQLETGSADAGAPIECFVATGIIRVQKGSESKGFAQCDFEETEYIGTIAQGTDLFYHPVIDTVKEGLEKKVPAASVATFPEGGNIGAIRIGNLNIGGNTMVPDRAPFSKRSANVPSVGTGIQCIWRSAEDGHAFGISGYKIYGREFSDSFQETH